ncbi:YdcF family protein [Anabaena minutissima FACHB-250]|nr:YdcF family protein [Anabaena minutissima FACHB-250]
MRHNFTKNSSIPGGKKFRRWLHLLQKISWGLCFLFGGWLILVTINLFLAFSQPVDAFFVLGGSIRREIYIAQTAKQYPQIPILISQGSKDPCIWLIFQRETADLQNVWLEKCAKSTFENFYYGIPILKRWGVNKVKLITSPTHLPRAQWMSQILFGSHGMWVEVEVVQETGIPGNQESLLKTTLDITRSLLWAVLSQIIQPQCSNVTKLSDVDMQAWQSQGFKCERQGNLGDK